MYAIRWIEGIFGFLICVTLAACGGGGSGAGGGPDPSPPVATLKTTPRAELQLAKNTSCEALRDYVGSSIANLIINDAYPVCIDCVLTTVGAPGLSSDAEVTATAFDAVTGTNNQESGVDEMDLVEADANGNFYTLDGDYLVVANGLPPEDLREIAALRVASDGFARGLLLDDAGERLVVSIARFRRLAIGSAPLVAPDIAAHPAVELLFVDVTDPANPVVDKKLLIDGFEIAARRIDSRVHLISHFAPVLPADILDDATLNDLRQRHADARREESDTAVSLAGEIRSRVAELLAAADIQDFLPGLWEMSGGGDYVRVDNANCEVSKPDVSMQYALTSITSVDTTGANIDNLTVTNNAWNVYASERSLYLIQPSSGWWWDRWQREQTAIYKFSIGAGPAEFAALGIVDGSAWNSFQFSEYEGFLRVATNRNEFDPATDAWTRDNNLYVLSDNAAGSMQITGSVEGFGKDESIFSARFLGDRGFVVTFRRIDPLFAFDLSNPNDPRLAGELEIPGVSTYIHPLGAGHLLTIGFSGDEQGLNPGFQLQLFDVQDLSAPRLLHKFEPDFDADGFAWTQATYDHLSFNYFADAGIVTIPVQYWAGRLDDHFSGFAAYSVDLQAGFAELGRLDHSDLARDEFCPTPAIAAGLASCEQGLYLEAASPKRSVAAIAGGETLIYTFSDVGIKASRADNFANAAGVLPLHYPNSYGWLGL